MNNLTKYFDGPARLLMCILFLVSGMSKLTETAYIQGYMQSMGVPGILIWPAAALELVGGVMLLIGLKVRPVSVVLGLWCILTAAIFHTAWKDPVQQLMFMKNMTMAGGFFMLAKSGSFGFSLDGYTARKRGDNHSRALA